MKGQDFFGLPFVPDLRAIVEQNDACFGAGVQRTDKRPFSDRYKGAGHESPGIGKSFEIL